MAASYLHLPSKSHCGIAKFFVQLNSLHQINIKTGIRMQKDFFMHSSHLFTYRDLPQLVKTVLQKKLRRSPLSYTVKTLMGLLWCQVGNFTSKLISCFIREQKRRRKASSFKSHKWDSSVNWGIVPAFHNLVKKFLKVHWLKKLIFMIFLIH